MTYRILIILSLLNLCIGQHDQFKFNHLTVEDGLSQGMVYSILEDSRGFMWFGTRFGLNRYDGHDFKFFSHDPEDSTSIPGYVVVSLFEDHSKYIWIGTETKGLARYNRDSENFQIFSEAPNDPGSLSSNRITFIFEDSNQTLWIGTKNGLNRFLPDQQKFIRYYHIKGDNSSLPSNHVSAIDEVSENLLLVGMESGAIATLDTRTEEFKEIRNKSFWPSRSSRRAIEAILKDRYSDNIWISRFSYGLTKFNLKEGILKQYDDIDFSNVASMDFAYDIAQDSEGKLWMPTINGITLFDPLTDQFTFNRPIDTNPTSVNDIIYHSIHIDRQGIIWVGSDSKGIDLHNPYQVHFQQFSHESTNSKGPSGNSVYSFAEDRFGDIWFTTMVGGTNRYDPKSGTFRYYQTDDTQPGTWSINYAMQVLVDQFYGVWIGTVIAGLNQVDPVSGERIKLHFNDRLNPNSLSGPTVFSLLETNKGTIWVGTSENGLNRFNRDEGNFDVYLHDPDDSTSLGGECLYALLEDHENVLWIGTARGGLSRYNHETDNFTTFKHSLDNDNSLKSNCILDLYEDANGNIWIGTRGGGLNKLDPTRTTFSTLDLGVENTAIIVYSIQEDAHGYLWLSTNNGLIKADPENGFLNRYTRDDGLQGNDFLYGSSLKATDGHLYFGGPNGFNRFHPDSIVNNPHIPPVVITNFKINYETIPIGEMHDGRVVLTRSITETDSIVLTHRDKTVSFNYAALDFVDPARNRFAIKLENFDDDWIQVGTDHSVTYTSLDPGDYVFRVKASNNNGIWNEDGVALSITVLPPFWKTWWFNLQLSSLLILIIFLYIRLRFRRIEGEKVKLEKLVIERTAELKQEIEERQRVETEKMQLKVDHLKRELVSKSIHATEKQEIMNNLFKELKNIQKMDANQMRSRFNNIIRYFQDMFKGGQDWDEFELWFTEVHNDFFDNLRGQHPELTQREIKVCALLRLNLISKDIANLMNVQPKTVEIYRHRIRKKIGLLPDNNLNKFFAQF